MLLAPHAQFLLQLCMSAVLPLQPAFVPAGRLCVSCHKEKAVNNKGGLS